MKYSISLVHFIKCPVKKLFIKFFVRRKETKLLAVQQVLTHVEFASETELFNKFGKLAKLCNFKKAVINLQNQQNFKNFYTD